jgi:formate dehydrogenase major subunit
MQRFDHEATTTCGYCGVGCRLETHVRDGKIASISPALDGPANKGHTCVKGRFAHQFTRSRDRLTTPLIREGGKFRIATWEEAIARITREFNRIKAEHGPDAIAGLASSRATNATRRRPSRCAGRSVCRGPPARSTTSRRRRCS